MRAVLASRSAVVRLCIFVSNASASAMIWVRSTIFCSVSSEVGTLPKAKGCSKDPHRGHSFPSTRWLRCSSNAAILAKYSRSLSNASFSDRYSRSNFPPSNRESSSFLSCSSPIVLSCFVCACKLSFVQVSRAFSASLRTLALFFFSSSCLSASFCLVRTAFVSVH